MSFWSTVGKLADKAAQAASDSYYETDATVFAMSDRELAKVATGQQSAGPVTKALVLKELFKRGYRSPDEIKMLL
jgi:hypothetical protein